MAKFVLDSYSLLAFFRDEAGADAVEKLLNEAAEDKHELFISVINSGEVYYMSCRKDGISKANLVWEAMQKFPLLFIEVNMDLADRKSTRLNSSHKTESRMPSSA